MARGSPTPCRAGDVPAGPDRAPAAVAHSPGDGDPVHRGDDRAVFPAACLAGLLRADRPGAWGRNFNAHRRAAGPATGVDAAAPERRSWRLGVCGPRAMPSSWPAVRGRRCPGARLLVVEGDRVTKGQTIAELDSLPQYQAALAAAKANLAAKEAALVQARATVSPPRPRRSPTGTGRLRPRPWPNRRRRASATFSPGVSGTRTALDRAEAAAVQAAPRA